MANTITFEIPESEAKQFEKMLDATLEILRRMEKESPERDARIDKMHEETVRNLAEAEKTMERVSRRIADWGISPEK
ncbi:hypothetical protein BH24ACI2_BH24ACI2_06590 [soil metagenome]|jgi:uncharacterized damage-inducible protein DinB|nr:hypothetical protein [Acidobacteriota bacterium]